MLPHNFTSVSLLQCVQHKLNVVTSECNSQILDMQKLSASVKMSRLFVCFFEFIISSDNNHFTHCL